MITPKKILAFIILLFTVTALFSFLLIPFPFYLRLSITIVCLLIVIMLITLLFFRDYLLARRSQDKRIRVKLENTTQGLLEKISSTLELRSLLFSIITVITNNLKLSGASIFLLDKDYNYYILKESFKSKNNTDQKVIPISHSLIVYLTTHKAVIVNSELRHVIKSSSSKNNSIVDILDYYLAAFCVPVFFENELIAIIFLGHRATKERLQHLENEFLKSLVTILGKPIHNAITHYETLKKVDELNSLYEVGKVISSSFELNKTINLIATNASILLKSKDVLIRLRNDLQKPFEAKKIVGLKDDQIEYLLRNQEITSLLTSKLVKEKISILIEDAANSPFFTEEYAENLGISSVMVIPLFDNDLNVMGELRLMRNHNQQKFNQSELIIASNLANNVTIALQNARIYSELSSVYNIGQIINSIFDFNKLQEKIISILEKEFSFKRILLFVYDKKSNKLIASQGKGWERKIYQELEIHLYKSIIGRSIIENRVIHVENAPKDPRVSPQIASFLNLKSFICIPLITPGKTVGGIIADYEHDPIQHYQINMSLLLNIANLSSMALANCLLYYESGKLNESLKKEQSKTNKELQIARHIQQGLLSTKIPDIQKMIISTKNIPCRSVGGDFFNFIPDNNNKLGFVIGDVSGKGVPAALIMTLASGIFSEVGYYSNSPQQTLIKANNSLREYLKEIPVFYVTAFYGIFDFNNNLFTYSKAGHNPPIYLDRKKHAVSFLDTEGSYLGTFEDGGFMEKSIPLQPGDKLIFYTDGITEARNAHREIFGRDNLSKLALKYSNLSPDDLIKKVLEEINKYTQNAEQNDDLILVVCEINNTPGEQEALQTESYSCEIQSSTQYTKQIVNSILTSAAPCIKNKQQKFHLRLAITEALLNAIEHGNKNDITKIVQINYLINKKKITVEIADQGTGFKPENVVIPENSTESKGRGRGLLAIKACMDEIAFNTTGNMITLTKYFI